MSKPAKETLRHKQAFDYYLSLGDSRSYSDVAAKFDVSSTSVAHWSLAFGWGARVDEREKAIAEKISKKVDSNLVKLKSRQIRMSQAVQGLFAKRLNSAVDSEGNLKKKGYKPSAMDAARWAEIEQKLEGISSRGTEDPENPLEGEDIERGERIILERFERLRRLRKNPDEGN